MRKRYRGWLIVILVLNLAVLSVYGWTYYRDIVPEEIRIIAGEEERFSFGAPLKAKFEGADIGVVEINQKPLDKDSISVDLSKPMTVLAKEKGNITMELRLFGLFPIKKVEISAVTQRSVVVGGSAIGIEIETDGILVLGTATIITQSRAAVKPAQNRLKTGDYVMEVNGERIADKETLIQVVEESEGKELSFTIKRGRERMQVAVTPVLAQDGKYRLGVWVRDDTQGIGTLTYVTHDGRFGALGHGITDVDTGVILKVGTGSCYSARILKITKGKSGAPGEMCGVIESSDANKIGRVEKNTGQGVFGTMDASCRYTQGRPIAEIAFKREVRKGRAYIMCEIDGVVSEYEIEIEKIDYENENHTKELVIRITDEELLEKTGGIVQGMSGSPILQDGKLIGAVTHVFVNNPTKGYGIFVEEMLAQ